MSARFISDQNTVGFKYESGTYAEPTGNALQWVGLIQEHVIDESTSCARSHQRPYPI